MAVYERNQGQLLPSSNTMPALPSKDIGSIIVRSLQNALSADSGSDDELPDKIAEGINRSDIANGQKKGGVAQNGGEGNPKSPIDNLLKSGETARTKAYEKHLKSEAAAEKKAREERAKRDQAIEKAFDTTLRGLSTFAQNPLKGLDNALQAGLKFGLKGLSRLPDLFSKDNKKDGPTGLKKGGNGSSKEGIEIEARVFNAIEGSFSNMKLDQVGLIISSGSYKPTLIECVKSGIDESLFAEAMGGDKLNAAKENQARLAALKTPKQEKDQKEVKEANVEKKRDKQANAQLAETAKTNLTVGMIFGKLAALAIGLAAVALLIPIIAGHLADLVLNFKYAAKETPVKFGAFMRKAKAVLFGGLYDLAAKLKWPGVLGGGSFLNPALSEEEKAEYNELERTQLVKDYEAAKIKMETGEKNKAALARYEALMQKRDSEGLSLAEKLELGRMVNKVDSYKRNIQEAEDARKNVEFWEANNVQIKRWNELKNTDIGSLKDRMTAEAEDWENEEYGKLYKGMLERGEMTANQAAWAMTKGGASKSGAAAQAISEFTDKVKKGEASFAPETGLEAGKRRGLQVQDAFVNLFGELGHNLFMSTKSAYQKKNTADPNATLNKAVQNYHNTVNNITTATPSNMGAGPR
jgi:hypothetical protein